MSEEILETQIVSNTGELFTFSELVAGDAEPLGRFFEGLSKQTRSKFGPHSLTRSYASHLCLNLGTDGANRFIITSQSGIVGYFILDFNEFKNEERRYEKLSVNLNAKIDPVFAPCIADKYQNAGLASQAMKNIIEYARNRYLRRIVLMGGTQEPNMLARQFYSKFGFQEYDRFYTQYNGLNNIDMMLTLNE